MPTGGNFLLFAGGGLNARKRGGQPFWPNPEALARPAHLLNLPTFLRGNCPWVRAYATVPDVPDH